MLRPCFLRAGAVLLLLALNFRALAGENVLPHTQPLTIPGDLSAQMVAGIDSFLLREIERSVEGRPARWARDFSSPEIYAKSIELNRQRFRARIGVVDKRLSPAALEFVSSTSTPATVAETDRYTVYAVRWPVFEGVFGEGLLLQPKTPPVARVVAVPDADQTPEMLAGLGPGMTAESQFARRLAEQGCQVIVPVLVNRQDTWSGNAALERFTNQPHREWIYRQAFELGRHIIGYEVQMILSAVDWLARENQTAPAASPQPGVPAPRPLHIGVAGYAEGGLLAFYSAALDPRLDAALVSGYFDSRQKVWEEPIYRNVFGLLEEFGDAELATLIAPRRLIVEQSEAPKVDGPPAPREGRRGAAPGKWGTPDFNTVDMEVGRANALLRPLQSEVKLVHGNEGMSVGPGSDRALEYFLGALGVAETLWRACKVVTDLRPGFDPAPRQKRQCAQWVEHTQRLLRLAERDRNEFLWKPLAVRPGESAYRANTAGFKSNLWNEVIGRFPKAGLPAHARTRKVYEEPRWTGYDVVLDVWPDVYAWGVLLLPNDLKPGERRPVVVCQHGLEGVPADTFTREPTSRAYGYYQAFSARLAERGFIVFAPHNPYRGGDRFRILQRKANSLGKSLFSVILAQQDRIRATGEGMAAEAG